MHEKLVLSYQIGGARGYEAARSEGPVRAHRHPPDPGPRHIPGSNPDDVMGRVVPKPAGTQFLRPPGRPVSRETFGCPSPRSVRRIVQAAETPPGIARSATRTAVVPALQDGGSKGWAPP